ncbi:MAG: hypothetical protein Q9222_002723 [Ikaeria aurantiellina]
MSCLMGPASPVRTFVNSAKTSRRKGLWWRDMSSAEAPLGQGTPSGGTIRTTSEEVSVAMHANRSISCGAWPIKRYGGLRCNIVNPYSNGSASSYLSTAEHSSAILIGAKDKALQRSFDGHGAFLGVIVAGEMSEHRRRYNDGLNSALQGNPTVHTKVRSILLSWGRDHLGDAQKFVLYANISPKPRSKTPQSSVIWQHSNFEGAELGDLESSILPLEDHGLRDGEIGLTKRLLKRVRLVSERPFVGGSFLMPKATRYEMYDKSLYGGDKTCMFLNFPFFTVKKAQPTQKLEKGDLKHPTRTLLQTRYRLNETTERDKSQCIRTLPIRSLESCEKGKTGESAARQDKAINELIYIPQIWVLIMGQRHVATSGPISDQDLQGPHFACQEQVHPHESLRCTLCSSWFELLNKHQRIRNALDEGTGKVTPKDCPLQIGGHRLDGYIWANVQRNARGGILKLRMVTPGALQPSRVAVEGADPDSGLANDRTFPKASPFSSTKSIAYTRLNPVPIVKAFLSWRIVDDFGEEDGHPMGVQTENFLNTIYGSLCATCTEPRKGNQRLEYGARSKMSIVGRTSLDVGNFDRPGRHGSGENTFSIEQMIHQESCRILAYFVPDEYDKSSDPIRLFWGMIFELLDKREPYLPTLLDQLKKIGQRAENLHLGVHCMHPASSERPNECEDSISEGAILQASMVDALGAIYNMLVEAIHGVHSCPEHERLAQGQQALRYSDEACNLLDQAKSQLIIEATGTLRRKSLGPVVTPEGVVLLMIERLIQGVHRNGKVNVINILEECLEQLVSLNQ